MNESKRESVASGITVAEAERNKQAVIDVCMTLHRIANETMSDLADHPRGLTKPYTPEMMLALFAILSEGIAIAMAKFAVQTKLPKEHVAALLAQVKNARR